MSGTFSSWRNGLLMLAGCVAMPGRSFCQGALASAAQGVNVAQTRPRFVTRLLAPFHKDPDLAFVAAAVLTLILVAFLLFLASTLDPKCPKAQRGSNWLRTITNWIGHAFACCRHQLLKILIEGDTQSYSLSKLQFLLWTVATVYGYTYLWIAHSWVQGLEGLPDVTGKFPWETLLAGGTAVASQVSKQAFGTKGGGPLKPQLSDLISAGGVIASGRIQFLSWTLVAITAYLASVLASDPATIQLLPVVPERLLEISGISAGAYLAARSVSSAGPLLTSALYTLRGTRLSGARQGVLGAADGGTLLLIGDSLSKNATLQAYEKRPEQVKADEAQNRLAGSVTTPAVEAMSGVEGVPILGFKYEPPPFIVNDVDGVAGSPGMYTRMTVNILGWPMPPQLPPKWTIRVTNPDGKYAEAEVAMHDLPVKADSAEPAYPVDKRDAGGSDAPVA